MATPRSAPEVLTFSGRKRVLTKFGQPASITTMQATRHEQDLSGCSSILKVFTIAYMVMLPVLYYHPCISRQTVVVM